MFLPTKRVSAMMSASSRLLSARASFGMEVGGLPVTRAPGPPGLHTQRWLLPADGPERTLSLLLPLPAPSAK